jgi:hypothetical protein
LRTRSIHKLGKSRRFVYQKPKSSIDRYATASVL